MLKQINAVWKTASAKKLAEVLVNIDDVQTMQNFLRDVMTKKEIVETSARLQAAQMLLNGERYTNITTVTKLSSRTVARISDWLQNGCGGYQTVLRATAVCKDHSPPARAE